MKVNLSEDELKKIFVLRDEFVYTLEGWELFDYQKAISDKIIRSVLNNSGDTIPAEISRQAGKTSCVVDTIIFLLIFYFPICREYGLQYMNEFNIGFFAPQIFQAKTDFDSLKTGLEKCKSLGFIFQFEEFNGNTIHIKGDKDFPKRTVYCMTASPTSHQESKTLHLIIYEESQDIDDLVVKKSIAPMGSFTNATSVWIGVSGYKRCMFWELLNKIKESVIVPFNMVLQAHELMFQKTGNFIYQNYKKSIEKAIREYGGEESDGFKTQYKLEWILERGQFITYHELMALEDNYSIPLRRNVAQPCYAGIDWGKKNDSTVFIIVDDECRIIHIREFQGIDYASQCKEIARIVARNYLGLKIIRCDSTSNQDMAVDMLRNELETLDSMTVVEGVPFTSISKDKMYKNLWRLMHDIKIDEKVIERAKLRFNIVNPYQREKFVSQFIDLTKDIRANKWVCNHPAGPNYHDDYCDSLALSCLAFLPGQAQEVEYDVF